MTSFTFLIRRRLPTSTLFPYTTLFRSTEKPVISFGPLRALPLQLQVTFGIPLVSVGLMRGLPPRSGVTPSSAVEKVHPSDRKSTRLNSSHLGISYAVFCLKKKRTQHA